MVAHFSLRAKPNHEIVHDFLFEREFTPKEGSTSLTPKEFQKVYDMFNNFTGREL